MLQLVILLLSAALLASYGAVHGLLHQPLVPPNFDKATWDTWAYFDGTTVYYYYDCHHNPGEDGWNTVVSVEDGDGSWDVLKFSAVQCRRVQVVCTQAGGSTLQYAVYSFDVYE